jgi:hypothetical protein
MELKLKLEVPCEFELEPFALAIDCSLKPKPQREQTFACAENSPALQQVGEQLKNSDRAKLVLLNRSVASQNTFLGLDSTAFPVSYLLL